MKPNNLRFLKFFTRTGLAALLFLFCFGCKQPTDEGASLAAGANAPSAQPPLVPVTNMVPIKAGSFIRMNHKVTLTKDFWIGKFEVTQGEYASLMGKNPSHFQDAGTNCPVEKLSNFDAMAYCAVLTRRERDAGRLPANYEYRLPTEAEWEYACRAGTTNLYSFGDDITVAGEFAWTAENSDQRPQPVGQKRPNPWGLHDIHGNVWEWCVDYFEPYPKADVIDPVGPSPAKFKVFRGGSWNHDIEMARSANRFMMAPANGIFFVGFRVVLGEITSKNQ